MTSSEKMFKSSKNEELKNSSHLSPKNPPFKNSSFLYSCIDSLLSTSFQNSNFYENTSNLSNLPPQNEQKFKNENKITPVAAKPTKFKNYRKFSKALFLSFPYIIFIILSALNPKFLQFSPANAQNLEFSGTTEVNFNLTQKTTDTSFQISEKNESEQTTPGIFSTLDAASCENSDSIIGYLTTLNETIPTQEPYSSPSSIILETLNNSQSILQAQNLVDSSDSESGTEKIDLKSIYRSFSQIRRDLSKKLSEKNYPEPLALVTSNGAEDVVTDELKECDRVFISTPGGVRNGSFESPTLLADEGHSLQCIYTFVARPGERVQLTFTKFNIRGIPPECAHEWVDLYTEVDSTDVTDLISTPFGGRYCGMIPPRTRISLYGGIAIGYYSDKNYTDDGEVRFRGTYAFFTEERYQIGKPVPRTICSYNILGVSKRQGELLSPTYPGVYPKELSCSYKFEGTPGQRIRLEFRDFDVFAGGAHCPFDDVKIYDGLELSSPIIGTYCGQYRYLVVYSSEHQMLVTFNTNERVLETQNRGFLALWEFSESFVKLDFITKNAGTHIRGSECDQRILSKGLSTGVLYSPNYPFPYLPKIYCRYFIYGVQDPQNLERIKLNFEKFDVPSNAQSEEEQMANAQQHSDKTPSKCGDGYLKIYVKGQELTQQYDKHDYEFCGKEVPHDVASDGPRVVLVFSSGETQGSGFKAKYTFETEYRVPGTPSPSGSCEFTYHSSSSKRGEFNSPRFPSNYPSSMNCTYSFITESGEQVRIVFDHFKVRADSVNSTSGAYGEHCREDWVEIYNVFRSRGPRLVGRYCATTAPGPIESHEEAEGLKVLLHTDSVDVFSGFKARYIFFTATSIFGECGMNITGSQTGIITSPGWPNKYEGPRNREGSNRCNWFLSVTPGNRVLLHFKIFSIEGSPTDRGCPSAAVRIWEDPEGLPIELCGESLPSTHTQFVSNKNLMRMTFITADKAVGDRGFMAIWTEVHERYSLPSGCPPLYSKCEKNPYCIPKSLRCDGTNNCGLVSTGESDSSDEDFCGMDGELSLFWVGVLSVSCACLCFLTVCLWTARKRRRRRRRQQLRRPPIHVCDNAGARFAAMDSV